MHFHNVGARDNLTECLSDLGFLAPSSDEGERWPYELIVDADAMADFAVQSLQMSEAGKQRLLDQMICYAGDCMDIPVTRQWFDASGPTLQLMSTMVDFGYAEAKSRQYRWTDLIGPSMRATHFWDEGSGSVDDGPFRFHDDWESSSSPAS